MNRNLRNALLIWYLALVGRLLWLVNTGQCEFPHQVALNKYAAEGGIKMIWNFRDGIYPDPNY